MEKSDYDTIVIGAGGSIGSAASYREACNGSDVLGLEQFELGHSMGEGGDHSRIIRRSYHADYYTSLTARWIYDAWNEVETESGEKIVLKTGGLDLDSDPDYLQTVADSMEANDIPYENLSPDEVMQRWPAFNLPEDMHCLYQPDSGLVDAFKATAAHVRLAREHGANIKANTPVTSIELKNGSVVVTAKENQYEAGKLIIAGGPWTKNMLRPLGLELPLTCSQEQVVYYENSNEMFSRYNFPIWLMHYNDANRYYGFPIYGLPATKAGIHMGGHEVTPDNRSFDPDQDKVNTLTKAMARFIPGFAGKVLLAKTCLYTLTPDRDYIVDNIPGHPNTAVFVGAGHAFKAAAFMGKVLSELVSAEGTSYPIDKFKIDRPALTDPDYAPADPHFGSGLLIKD